MSRARSLLLARFVGAPVAAVAAGAALLGVAGAGLAACGSTGSGESIPPITGVTVRAETLTAGRGCGTAPTQLFKYAVVVFARGEYVAGNVYDCFTDGTFVELPDIGTSLYTMEVFAYSRAAYVAAGGDAVAAIMARLNANHAVLGTDAGGPPQREAIEADLKRLRSTNPTYSTTCTAEQLGLVQTLAVCKPLQLGAGGIGVPAQPASVVLSLAKFPKADGSFATCDDQYVAVRTKFRVGGVDNPATTDTRCSALGETGLQPVSVTISPAVAPASYVFTATLLRADGSTVGTTTCGAETSPGLTSAAVCQPLP